MLLTHLLLDTLTASAPSSIVNVSSSAHRVAKINFDDLEGKRGYSGWRAYAQSKLANVLFTLELNRQLGASSTIRAFAVDPGLVNTDIGLKGTPRLARWIWGLRSRGGVSPAESAQGVLHLLCEPSAAASDAIYWKNGAPKKPDNRALDSEAAARLWKISAQMCGIARGSAQAD